MTLCFTSGTTGRPKASIITHRNFLSCVAALHFSDIRYNKNDVHLSYLPMTAIYERCFFHLCGFSGAKVGIFSNNIKKILQDL